MRVLGYICDSSRRILSSDEQKASLDRFCQRGNHTLVETFIDHDTEGERPQFNAIGAYLEASGEGFLVVCAGAEYLGSELSDALVRILEFDALPVHQLLCSDDNQPDPLRSALAYWTKQNASMDRGEKIREAMLAKAVRGDGLGKPAYGYEVGPNGRLQIQKEEARVVQRIFQLYTKRGQGIRTVARSLNQTAEKTRRGQPWSMVTIRDILRNRTYLGTYSRFGMLVPGNHTPIVTREVYREAQGLMQSKRRPRRPAQAEPFLLSGLARCKACGNRMIGVARRQSWKRKDGEAMQRAYRYYQCQSRTNHGICRFHTWRAQSLEENVKIQVLAWIGTKTIPSRGKKQTVRSRTNARRSEQRLLQELRDTLQGKASLIVLREALSNLQDASRATKNEDNLNSSERPIKTAFDLRTTWSSRPVEEVRDVLAALIECVEVDDEEARVIFARL